MTKVRDTPEGMKWCPDCQGFKNLSEFHRAKYQPKGRQGYCAVRAMARKKLSRDGR